LLRRRRERCTCTALLLRLQCTCDAFALCAYIVNCAAAAQGILDAAKEVWGGSPKVPLVVRLQGNNVEGAMELMKNSNVKCILGDDLDDAAKKVVAAIGK
jgi:succinyl-CoA synthetase beta subunit